MIVPFIVLDYDVCKNCASPSAWLQTISIHRRRRIIKIILELGNIGHFVSLDYKVGVIIIVVMKMSLQPYIHKLKITKYVVSSR